jgi:2-polyprenyl-6-methoxyphenol hydroxylase-like FAD-dependent oxidoreductase
MSKAIIIGGSVAGLAGALALSELGYDVEILERDPSPPPETVEDAHNHWSRPTVPQSTHSHAFASLGVNLLRERTPDIYAALVAAGAGEIQLAERKPPTLKDAGQEPEDVELNMLACRRSTFELVFRREVLRRPQITARLGTTVRGLEFSRSGGRRVTGVRTEGGQVVHADIVIDAAGRRSPVTQWLAEAGVPVATDQVESCEITYYTRFYRSLTKGPAGPLNRGFGAGGLWDHYTAVLFLGDNGTFSVSMGVLPQDTLMKGLRNEPAFTAAVRATPLLAPWIAPGNAEPISGVHAMGGLDNMLRGAATTRQDPVPGLFFLGDSACTTNPAYGRGVSLALAHAFAMAEVLKADPSVGEEQAREMAQVTERLFTPWFEEAVQNDRGRGGLWRATVSGVTMPPPPEHVITFGAVAEAGATDPVVWRRLVRVMMSLSTPDTVYGDEDVRARVTKALAARNGHGLPGASREQLVQAVTETAAA